MKVVVALFLISAVSCSPDGYGYQPKHDDKPAYYNFNYGVNDHYSGANFGHNEHRDGHNTKGSYYVQLPDGRLQKVDYTVNGYDGYQAYVTYQGQAYHPPSHGKGYGGGGGGYGHGGGGYGH